MTTVVTAYISQANRVIMFIDVSLVYFTTQNPTWDKVVHQISTAAIIAFVLVSMGECRCFVYVLFIYMVSYQHVQ